MKVTKFLFGIGLLASIIAAIAPVPSAQGAFPGRSGRLVYSRHGDLFMASPPFPGGRETRLTSGAEIDAEPKWSPNGRWVAFERHTGGSATPHVWMVDPRSRSAHAFTAGSESCVDPSWSPDSRFLVFVCSRTPQDGDVLTAEVGSNGQRGHGGRLVTDETFVGREFDPAWSPNGQEIAFAGFRSGDSSAEIYTVDVTGPLPAGRSKASNFRHVTTNGLQEYDPSWTPDGARLAYTSADFSSSPPRPQQIHTVNADGSNQSVYISGSRDFRAAAWSPDGRELAFAHNSFGDPYIAVVEPGTGSGVRNVAYGNDPDWETVGGTSSAGSPAPSARPPASPSAGSQGRSPGSRNASTPTITLGPDATGAPRGGVRSTPRPVSPLQEAKSASRAEIVPSVAAPGDRVTMRGQGFRNGARIVVELRNGGTKRVARTVADAAGRYDVGFVVPPTKRGDYRVDATGPGRRGGTHDSYAPLQIGAVRNGRVVAADASGFPWWVIAILAVLLSIAIACAAMRQRRRATA